MSAINCDVLKEVMVEDLVEGYGYEVPQAIAWVHDNGERVIEEMWYAYTTYFEMHVED